MITVDDIKKSHWHATLFASGTDPKHIQVYKCVEFPRFTKSAIKPKNGPWVVTYAVDSVEIERGEDVEAFMKAVADALNKEPVP